MERKTDEILELQFLYSQDKRCWSDAQVVNNEKLAQFQSSACVLVFNAWESRLQKMYVFALERFGVCFKSVLSVSAVLCDRFLDPFQKHPSSCDRVPAHDLPGRMQPNILAAIKPLLPEWVFFKRRTLFLQTNLWQFCALWNDYELWTTFSSLLTNFSSYMLGRTQSSWWSLMPLFFTNSNKHKKERFKRFWIN